MNATHEHMRELSQTVRTTERYFNLTIACMERADLDHLVKVEQAQAQKPQNHFLILVLGSWKGFLNGRKKRPPEALLMLNSQMHSEVDQNSKRDMSIVASTLSIILSMKNLEMTKDIFNSGSHCIQTKTTSILSANWNTTQIKSNVHSSPIGSSFSRK